MQRDHYEHGNQIDPDAERELREWASSQPNDPEPEFGPIPHPADINPYSPFDFDELGRGQDRWRRMYDEERFEPSPHRPGVFGG